MYRVVIFTVFFGGAAMANTNYLDFSGNWKGTCTFNGQSKPAETVIEQVDEKQIKIDGKIFFLDKPTVYEIADVDNGDKYKEITVYDFYYDSSNAKIITSAKWLGWYLEKTGTWSGEGTGYMEIMGSTLTSTRKFTSNFGNGDELCNYSK